MARNDNTYEDIKADLLRRGRLFEDPDFPATGKSLRNDGYQPYSIKWRRPGEITTPPQFTTAGAHRFDLNQGELGDCWFIAAAACLAVGKKGLFEHCVPPDQSFDEHYAGIFRFRFWRFGSWVEVIIDDRLPTKYGQLIYARNRTQRNEFWVPLLEKAYAKLNGSYENIDGGMTCDALVDFTGGISEYIEINDKSNIPRSLYSILVKTHRMNSMMGCAIKAQRISEEELPNGLYKGHAYSITGFAQTAINDKEINLLRLRNPWGKGEWNGRWSDRSREWSQLSVEERQRIGPAISEDGEFWISYGDWVTNFEDISICHLTPESIFKEITSSPDKQDWSVTAYHGSWIKGFNSGGADPSHVTFWTNPQYEITLSEADDHDSDGKCTVIVSLMQKTYSDEQNLQIGFYILQVKSSTPALTDGSNYKPTSLKSTDLPMDPYINLREKSGRFVIDPGRYVIIPTTYNRNEEANFMLRIFTEKLSESAEVDEPTRPITPENDTEALEISFKKFTDGDKLMDAEELALALNSMMAISYGTKEEFSVDTARSLMDTRDNSRTGVIRFPEYKKISTGMKLWMNAFESFDRDKSGYVDTQEMTGVFRSIGFALSRNVAASIIRRYGGKDRRLSLDSFIHCTAKLMVLYDSFKKHVGNNSEKAELTLEEWLAETM